MERLPIHDQVVADLARREHELRRLVAAEIVKQRRRDDLTLALPFLLFLVVIASLAFVAGAR